MKSKIVGIVVTLFLCVCAVAQTAKPHTDTPREGEGLNAFLLRNGYNINTFRNEFIKLNKGKLGQNSELRKGVKYVFPQKIRYAYEPLLGSGNDTVKIESNALEGATFYLVAGHGGPDPGAMSTIGKYTVSEDEYAYDIVLRLAQNLLRRSATVEIIIQDKNDGIRDDAYLSNSKDETCLGEEIPLKQTPRLRQRAAAINKLWNASKKGYTRSVFVHIDSRSEGERVDIFFYHHKNSTQGKRLANTMRQCFEDKYKKHQPQRGFTGTVSSRSLLVLNETVPAGVFLELGNIQNKLDQKRFLLSDNRQAIANWIAEALEKDFTGK